MPWGSVAWVLTLFGMLELAPAARVVIGPFGSYLLILLTVALGTWRFDRWCSRQYWPGRHRYRA